MAFKPGYKLLHFFVLITLLGYEITTAQDTVESLATRLDAVERKVTNLARKNQALAQQLTAARTVIDKLDEAKGVLTDYPECPEAPGFHHVTDLSSCYKMYPSAMLVNWTDAEALCQAASPKAHLVSLESRKEADFIKALWHNERGISTISRYWTGGTMENRRWSWSAFGTPMKYENWIPTTSHNDDRFSCLAVYANEAYHWLDAACWSSHAVTCEVAMTTTLETRDPAAAQPGETRDQPEPPTQRRTAKEGRRQRNRRPRNQGKA